MANDQRLTTNDASRRVLGIKLRDGRTVGAQAVIITTGTFLNGLIHCGEQQYPAGRSGEPNAILLGESLKATVSKRKLAARAAAQKEVA